MRVPSYRRHASGQARVTINGKDFLLGKYGSKESKQKFGRLICLAEYGSGKESGTFGKTDLLMQDVLLAFIRHARTYYQSNPREFTPYKIVVR